MVAKQVYQRVKSKYKHGLGVEIVRLDVSKADSTKNLKELIDFSGFSIEKIKRKNRPTFLVLRDDRLCKMKPAYFNGEFD